MDLLRFESILLKFLKEPGLILLDITAELINMSKLVGPPSDLFTQYL